VVGFVSRLVIISAENMASCRIVRRLLDLLAKDVSLVMMVPNLPVDTNNHLGRAWRLIRSASIGFLVFKFLEIHVHHVIAWISGATIWQQARGHGVKIRRYRSAADDNFLTDLRNAAPEFTLSAGPAILSRTIIDLASRGTLNCHGGRLPEYQGAGTYIWMLIQGEPLAYATIQRMAYKLDAGPVLAERAIAIPPKWSAYRLDYELADAGGQLYVDVVRQLLEGKTFQPIIRHDAMQSNRGFPKQEHMRLFYATGRKLFRPVEILRLI
jgi:folate-dependent phosphoribosylglycinamide formyltransferase PurN